MLTGGCYKLYTVTTFYRETWICCMWWAGSGTSTLGILRDACLAMKVTKMWIPGQCWRCVTDWTSVSPQLVSLLLIGIAAWGIGFGLISSLRVVGVVIAVGIFLFLIALVGLIGAVKHHQVLLFFVSFLKTRIFTSIRWRSHSLLIISQWLLLILYH